MSEVLAATVMRGFERPADGIRARQHADTLRLITTSRLATQCDRRRGEAVRGEATARHRERLELALKLAERLTGEAPNEIDEVRRGI
jgi:hypothetical protein